MVRDSVYEMDCIKIRSDIVVLHPYEISTLYKDLLRVSLNMCNRF